jgi:hypothetical protein
VRGNWAVRGRAGIVQIALKRSVSHPNRRSPGSRPAIMSLSASRGWYAGAKYKKASEQVLDRLISGSLIFPARLNRLIG